MLQTPSCCCLALDVLAGKDFLKSSFIVEISSSHNSSLKTLTGTIMLSSPQDVLSYTRGAAWLWARQGKGISVLVFPSMSVYLAFSQNSSCTTQVVFRHFAHAQNFCTVLFDRTIANWICDCQHSSCLGKAWLVRDLLCGNAGQCFGQTSPAVHWESAPMRPAEQHVAQTCCLGMKKGYTAT